MVGVLVLGIQVLISFLMHLLFLHIIAYSGRYCEEDRNGCSEVQCYVELSCRDIPAPDVGAECGPCPTGFTGDGNKCLGKVCMAFIRTRMASYCHSEQPCLQYSSSKVK